jgi:ribosomal protein S18 acetylase RimI-like enzyme
VSGPISFRAASELSLDALADLYTRCFAGYTYPVTVEPAALARRIRSEQIDLGRSPLICLGDEPVGVALLGVRDAETNCGGLGITAPHRGRGLAHLLLAEHLRLARAAGGQRISLMVLTENTGAVRTYLRAGMQITRTLLWLEWRGAPGPRGVDGAGAVVAEPGALLDQFAALPRAAPFWQRDLPTLRGLDGLEAWQIPGLDAYALVAPAADEPAQILDLAARDDGAARLIIAALQSRYEALCINEPEESPVLPPLLGAGFAVALTRHELAMEL